VRHVVGSTHAQFVHRVEPGPLVRVRELRLAGAALGGTGDDLVLDVGDVAHVGDVEADPLEVATDHVEHERGASVAHVGDVVDRRAAHVHRDLPGLAGDQLDRVAQQRVADPDGGHGCRGYLRLSATLFGNLGVDTNRCSGRLGGASP
jgi:hypothetical protein